MKLHSTQTNQFQTITGYDKNWVEVNSIKFNESVIINPNNPPKLWKVRNFDDLEIKDFSFLDELEPEILLLGTGLRQKFISPFLISELISKKIGIECMGNQPACRTYNILIAEGRKVTLALILSGII